MKIVNISNPILRQKTKPVLQIDKKILQYINIMKQVLEKQTDPPGVGLAAPQIGLPLQLFIIKPTKKTKPKPFINPRIRRFVGGAPGRDPTSAQVSSKHLWEGKARQNLQTAKKKTHLEGCLSIPRIWGEVKRADKVLLTYQTVDGTKKSEWFSGFEAIIIQHEMDHLQGILFTQRVLEQGKTLFEEKEGKLVKIG